MSRFDQRYFDRLYYTVMCDNYVLMYDKRVLDRLVLLPSINGTSEE